MQETGGAIKKVRFSSVDVDTFIGLWSGLLDIFDLRFI